MLTEQTTQYFIVVEAIMVVITLVLALISYVVEGASRAAQEDIGKSCCEKRQMGYFVARQPYTWSYFRRTATARIPKVPTVENLIQAGDRLMFTSAMFDHIDSSPQDVCWVSLYTQFFQGVAWLNWLQTHNIRQNEDIAKYLQKADERVKELSQPGKVERSVSKKNNHGTSAVDVEAGGTRRAHPVLMKPNSRTPVRHCLFPGRSKGLPILVSCVLPFQKPGSEAQPAIEKLELPDIRTLWLVDGKPCIEMSREELAGLALSLGIPLIKRQDGSISGTGPFGTHINLVRHVTHWRLRLTHQHRQFDHEAQYGSGYATLYAKHAACDCLPIDLEESAHQKQGDIDFGRKSIDTVRCIYVCRGFLKWIRGRKFARAVKSLELYEGQTRVPEYKLSPLEPVYQTCQELKYLYRLPTGFKVDAYCYTPDPFEDNNNDDSDYSNEDGRYTLHWFNAVARIAFGGLVPQAGRLLINAVLFTVTGEYRIDCELEEDDDSDHGYSRGRASGIETREGSSRRTRRKHSFVGGFRIRSLSLPYARTSNDDRPSSTHVQTPMSDRAWSPMHAKQTDPENSSSWVTMALQYLVDALHSHCYSMHEFSLFGEYVGRRARREFRWLDTDTSISSTPRHAGALFNRYMTALERLTAISLIQRWRYDVPTANDPANEVSSTQLANFAPETYSDPTKVEKPGMVERGLAAASKFFQVPETSTGSRSNRVDPKQHVKEIYEKCAQLLSENFGNEKNSLTLRDIVENVKTRIGSNREEDRITVEDCANVARCIIASWALRVPFIELEWEASDPSRLNVHAAFDELPSVLAFG